MNNCQSSPRKTTSLRAWIGLGAGIAAGYVTLALLYITLIA